MRAKPWYGPYAVGRFQMANTEVKSVFDIPPDEAAEAEADAAAEADIAAGRFVSHADVVKGLKSWGKPDERPCPTPKPR